MPPLEKPAILLRGGGKRKSLNLKEEKWLVRRYTKTELTVNTIIDEVSERFGKSICRKTFYNVLARHGAKQKGPDSSPKDSRPVDPTSLPNANADVIVHDASGHDCKPRS